MSWRNSFFSLFTSGEGSVKSGGAYRQNVVLRAVCDRSGKVPAKQSIVRAQRFIGGKLCYGGCRRRPVLLEFNFARRERPYMVSN